MKKRGENMTTSRVARWGIVMAVLATASAGCKSKQQPVAQATPPPTTVAPTTTTLPPPTTMATPPPVWRAARWGMTRQDVLAAFPGEAQKLATAANFAQPQPGSSLAGGTSDVGIPAYDLEGTRFRVLFGFDADALSRIHLNAAKAGAATCEDVEKGLTTQHGKPAQREKTGGSLKGDEITWKLADQTVVLSCAGVASLGFQTVSLDFLAPATAVAKN
jgi:hypothetical protein